MFISLGIGRLWLGASRLWLVFRTPGVDMFAHPGPLNACMHAFLDKRSMDLLGITHNSMCLDMGSETLNLKMCDMKL